MLVLRILKVGAGKGISVLPLNPNSKVWVLGLRVQGSSHIHEDPYGSHVGPKVSSESALGHPGTP